ncbi:hypothetical protein ACG74X_17720 [Marivita sp. S0852]|uniref:hypothetical protein n=1 Tax=Marivita sp. S0852 TaxID=3373893 RepID=UPI003982B68E
MSKVPSGSCSHRPLRPKDFHVSVVGLDHTEFQLLQIARWFFTSYSTPGTAWVRAFVEAEDFFGRKDGPRFAYSLLCVLQVMRRTRKSTFQYSNPACPNCAVILTEVERRLFLSLSELRQGRMGRAQTELMMLCEGNGLEDILIELQALVDILPARDMRHVPGKSREGLVRYV